MEFEVVLNKDRIRTQFIDQFIDTESEYYQKYIQTPTDNADYSGLLWLFLKGNKDDQYECTMEQALYYLHDKETVYVIWDVISLNPVLARNYPQDTVIQTDAKSLCRAIASEWEQWQWGQGNLYLPLDLYVFDITMKWCTVFTHEGYEQSSNPKLSEDDYIRICYLIKNYP